MASRGLHEFTVQEARNFAAFNDWNFELLETGSVSVGGSATTITATAGNGTSTYITETNPAKKVVMYVAPVQASGAGSVALDSGDILYIQLNGETANKKTILIDSGDLPFTISGVMITSLEIGNSDDDDNESVAMISYH